MMKILKKISFLLRAFDSTPRSSSDNMAIVYKEFFFEHFRVCYHLKSIDKSNFFLRLAQKMLLLSEFIQ